MAKKSILTLFIFSAFLGFYFLYLNPSSKTPGIAPQNFYLFPCRSSEDITAIEIEKPGQSLLRLEKLGAAWQMEKPYAGHADQIIAGGIAVALCRAESNQIISDTNSGLVKEAESGIGLRIRVFLKDNTFQKTLLIGRKHPVRDAYYAGFGEEPEKAFLLDGQLVRSLDKSDYALREKRIFFIQGKKATRITLNLFGAFVRLFYGLDGRWHLQEKPEATLNEKAVEEIFDQIQHLYVKEFLYDENPKERKFGIEKSDNFLSVIWEGGEAETLLIGKSLDERNAYYAIQGPEDSPLILIAKPNVHALARLPEDFIDRPSTV